MLTVTLLRGFCEIENLTTTYNHIVESMDEQKDNIRRQRRHSDSGSPLPTSDAHSDPGSSASVVRAGLSHFAPLLVDFDHVPTPRLCANSTGPSLEFSFSTVQHIGKRRASGEMIHQLSEAKTQPQARNGMRRPDLPQWPVVSMQTKFREQETQSTATSNVPQRASTRRTTTTTRWSPSMAGGRNHPKKPTRSMVTPPVRPISNATKNISFAMLQPHFERPLQHAADSFGVCTTLLKKICRRNGISNWPYRKICGLRKSIASMAKQVNYFDGEQKRAYADQLRKLEHELQAFLRTGNEPTEEFLRVLKAGAVSSAASDKKLQHDGHPVGIEDEDVQEEALEVPAWTPRPSIAQPYYTNVIVNELPTPPTVQFEGQYWHSRPDEIPVELPPQTLVYATNHRSLPSIASILQHQRYSSPSRAASSQDSRETPNDLQYEADQPTQWRYFPPANDDVV